jgi:hypothetical protein
MSVSSPHQSADADQEETNRALIPHAEVSNRLFMDAVAPGWVFCVGQPQGGLLRIGRPHLIAIPMTDLAKLLIFFVQAAHPPTMPVALPDAAEIAARLVQIMAQRGGRAP